MGTQSLNRQLNQDLSLESVLEALSEGERTWLTKSEHQMAARLRVLTEQLNASETAPDRAQILDKLITGLSLVRSCHLDRGGMGAEHMVRHALVMTFTEADWQRVRSSAHPLLVRVCELVTMYVEGKFNGDEAVLFDHLVNGTYYAYRSGLLVADEQDANDMPPDLAAWWQQSRKLSEVLLKRFD